MKFSVNKRVFLNCFGTSESKLIKVEKNNNELKVILKNVDILANKNTFRFELLDKPFNDLLNEKYFSGKEYEYELITYGDEVTFTFKNYSIFYEGNQDDVIDILCSVVQEINESKENEIVLGTAFEKIYDEFVIGFNDENFEVEFDEQKLKYYYENPKTYAYGKEALEKLAKKNSLKRK